jgi:hypothetical protein
MLTFYPVLLLLLEVASSQCNKIADRSFLIKERGPISGRPSPNLRIDFQNIRGGVLRVSLGDCDDPCFWD